MVVECRPSSQEVFCNIKVVQELVQRVVLPAVHLPRFVQCKGGWMTLLFDVNSLTAAAGIMLLGPPGVGKTYAVRAAQSLCKDLCKVCIHFMLCTRMFDPSQIHTLEISIPMLLADVDPVQRLERLLDVVYKLRKTRVVPVIVDETGRGQTPSGVDGPCTPVKGSSGLVAPQSGEDSARTPLSSFKTPLRYTGAWAKYVTRAPLTCPSYCRYQVAEQCCTHHRQPLRAQNTGGQQLDQSKGFCREDLRRAGGRRAF